MWSSSYIVFISISLMHIHSKMKKKTHCWDNSKIELKNLLQLKKYGELGRDEKKGMESWVGTKKKVFCSSNNKIRLPFSEI